MANVYGELRDGKIVCHRKGCEKLAVFSKRFHAAIACEEHEKIFELKDGMWTAVNGKFPIPDPPPVRPGQYVSTIAR